MPYEDEMENFQHVLLCRVFTYVGVGTCYVTVRVLHAMAVGYIIFPREISHLCRHIDICD
jgi:hypothetical protein